MLEVPISLKDMHKEKNFKKLKTNKPDFDILKVQTEIYRCTFIVCSSLQSQHVLIQYSKLCNDIKII